MSQLTINIGTSANDGTGDTLRDAFDKCNDNFTELYAVSGVVSGDTSPTLGGDLDVGGFSIVSASNGDITVAPNGSGNIELTPNTGYVQLDELKVSSLVISPMTSGQNISLTTASGGVTNINAINATGGTINGTTIGNSSAAAATFTTVVSRNHTPVTDALYSVGTLVYRWLEVNSYTLNGVKVVLGNPSTLTTSGAISVDKSYVKLNSSGGAIAATLADGLDGQMLVITMTVAGNNAVVTPSNAAGFTTLTFNSVGDTATLVFSAADWMLMSSYGVAIA